MNAKDCGDFSTVTLESLSICALCFLFGVVLLVAVALFCMRRYDGKQRELREKDEAEKKRIREEYVERAKKSGKPVGNEPPHGYRGT